MEVIKSKRGGRRPGAGRKKEPSRRFKDAIQNIDDSEIIESLTTWARGRKVICPHCDKDTGAYTADTVALQSALELLNRKRGKVPQSVQLDITETIQLTGDQIDLLIERYLPMLLALIVERYLAEIVRTHEAEIRKLLAQPLIEGEYKELPDDIVKDRW